MNLSGFLKFKNSVFFLVLIPFYLFSQNVLINEGSFIMGSIDNNAEADEKPEHEITLSSFKISKNEVTFAQYDSCVKSGICAKAHYDDGKCLSWSGNGFRTLVVPQDYRSPDYPVVCVTWHQAVAYCRSKGMRLPSEAQWEYAAKSGTDNRYSWGNEPPSENKCACNGKLQSIGSNETNKWGLNDMTGNVWEWTDDYYDKQYYSFSPEKDPSGPDAGFYRVIRGGGFYSGPSQLRTTNRHWFSPDYAEISIGFRCVR